MTKDRILAVRSGGLSDVLLAEPAFRALAADADVVVMCEPQALPAARMLAAVTETVAVETPWSGSVDRVTLDALAGVVSDLDVRRAIVFTSQYQSPLPMALVLRLAGVPFIAGRSVDDAGSLLDVRLAHDTHDHEVERNLELVEAIGLPAPFDRRLRVRPGSPVALPDGSIVVHPGASAPSRTPSPAIWREVIGRLAADGHPVVLTGDRHDLVAASMRAVDGVAVDLVGQTDFAGLGGVLASADALCVGHSAPMHLAAAVGTPVVALFPATVPPERWRPWMVEHDLVTDPNVPCAPCFRKRCSVSGQPCVAVDPEDVAVRVARHVRQRTLA